MGKIQRLETRMPNCACEYSKFCCKIVKKKGGLRKKIRQWVSVWLLWYNNKQTKISCFDEHQVHQPLLLSSICCHGISIFWTIPGIIRSFDEYWQLDHVTSWLVNLKKRVNCVNPSCTTSRQMDFSKMFPSLRILFISLFTSQMTFKLSRLKLFVCLCLFLFWFVLFLFKLYVYIFFWLFCLFVFLSFYLFVLFCLFYFCFVCYLFSFSFLFLVVLFVCWGVCLFVCLFVYFCFVLFSEVKWVLGL